MPHLERHRNQHVGWLRAAVLGANDGLVSTASLVIGVAAAEVTRHTVLVAGMAGLVAGAFSMAAGEYVSVSSQSDTERADLRREALELETDPEGESRELTAIYVARGLTPELARAVAEQLTAGDALRAHAREELGMTDELAAKPLQAAASSAAAFAVGAGVPLVSVLFSPDRLVTPVVGVVSLVCLAGLGGLAAYIGGASVPRGAMRVVIWGVLAMAASAAVGTLFQAPV